MVQDIVFHLGDCKTGTTSIQSTLSTGAWESPSEILYPARFNHMELARTLNVGAQKPQQKSRFLRLRKALNGSDAAHAVISAEHFEFVDPELLAAALKQYFPALQDRVRLIAYVRPHAERLVSTFAERSKKGIFMKSLPQMHQRLRQSQALMYTPRFERWRAVFGDRFTLRPFVRSALYQGDVVQDLFRHILGNTEFRLTGESVQNTSLSVEDLAMLRAMHRVFQSAVAQDKSFADQRRAFGWFLSEHLTALANPEGTRLQLHRSLAHQVVKTYRADAVALDAAFFEGTPMTDALDAAPDKAGSVAHSVEPEDHFSPAELRRFEAQAQFILHLAQSDPRHFNWAIRPDNQRAARPPRGTGVGALARRLGHLRGQEET